MNWNEMEQLSREYAQAKAERVHLDHYRKIVLAQLKREAPEKSNAAQEDWARTQPKYLEVIDGIKEATQNEAQKYWRLHIAEMRFEQWRSNNATKRAEMTLL